MSESINKLLLITRSGMLARLTDLDVVSNNISNINTTGYKSTRSNFQELFESQLYNGTQLRATQRIFDQGSLVQTSNELDLAIQGDGFFGVTLPDGRIAYTRDGTFSLDSDRRLVTAQGFPVVWDGTIPEDATDLVVNKDGSVMAKQGDVWNQLGTIQLNRFINPLGLLNNGNNLLLESEVSGPVQTGASNSEGYGQIFNHTLEASNVNLANEVTQMVILQRSFQLSLRAFQQTDLMLSQAISMRR